MHPLGLLLPLLIVAVLPGTVTVGSAVFSWYTAGSAKTLEGWSGAPRRSGLMNTSERHRTGQHDTEANSPEQNMFGFSWFCTVLSCPVLFGCLSVLVLECVELCDQSCRVFSPSCVPAV